MPTIQPSGSLRRASLGCVLCGANQTVKSRRETRTGVGIGVQRRKSDASFFKLLGNLLGLTLTVVPAVTTVSAQNKLALDVGTWPLRVLLLCVQSTVIQRF